MTQEYVFLQSIKAEPFTTSQIIAEQTGNSYRSVQRLIEKQISALESFGRVRFEITPFETNGGIQKKKIYHLNELQATLLITFLKNTEVVIAFKTELIRQFFIMRDELQHRKYNRTQLVKVHKDLAEVVKNIPSHEHARFDYAKYNNLAYMLMFGKSAKKLKQERGAEPTQSIVDYLTADELEQLADVKDRICLCIEMAMPYDEIKQRLGSIRRLSVAV